MCRDDPHVRKVSTTDRSRSVPERNDDRGRSLVTGADDSATAIPIRPAPKCPPVVSAREIRNVRRFQAAPGLPVRTGVTSVAGAVTAREVGVDGTEVESSLGWGPCHRRRRRRIHGRGCSADAGCRPGVRSVSAGRALAGTVLGGGAPIVASTVTLWSTGETGGPTRLAQSHTDAAGRFKLSAPGQHGGSPSVFYVVAKGGHPASSAGDASNDAIALMTVLGATPPARITINELTTVASVWTSAQFLDGAASAVLRSASASPRTTCQISSTSKPAATALRSRMPLNSTETPTMANLATLSSLLAGCTTEVRDDACQSLFAAVRAGGG